MINREISIDLMYKNLNKFEQNVDTLLNNSKKSKLSYSFSFNQISNILGFLTTSITGNKKNIIEILTVIIDSGKFSEKNYQDLVIKTLEYFEDMDFRLFY